MLTLPSSYLILKHLIPVKPCCLQIIDNLVQQDLLLIGLQYVLKQKKGNNIICYSLSFTKFY